MPKFYGVIGFANTKETAPGVYEELITKRRYYAEIVRNTRRWVNAEGLNDNIDISNEFSVLADSYAINNFSRMRYIEMKGTKWKISNISIQYPRLVLTVGGVYND